MVSKIIYIFERRHYYTSDDKSFGIQYFKGQGYDVEVWSAVYWTFGNNIASPQNEHEGNRVYINNEKMMQHEMERIRNENCCFIIYPYHAYSKVSYAIRKEIKKNGFDFYNLTESPDLVEVKELPPKSVFVLKGLKKLIYMMYVLIKQGFPVYSKRSQESDTAYRFWGPILLRSKANFIVTKNQFNYIPNPWELFRKDNILVPHINYGLYLELLNSKSSNTTKYAVFIDEYEVGHSDFEKFGIKSPISDPKQYYMELNSFFSRIEEEFGTDVIIAAHPKAEYYGDEFEGRKIIYYRTAELVKEAEIVLYMYGTSVSYILLFQKKFMQFYTSQHFKGNMTMTDSFIKESSVRLNTNLLNISTMKGVRLRNYVKCYGSDYDDLLEKFIVPKCNMKEDMYMIIDKVLRDNK